MKCSECDSNYQVDGKGRLFCPTCNSNIKKKLNVVSIRYNEIEYYKVMDSDNIATNTYLLPEELDTLIKEGVEVRIKR